MKRLWLRLLALCVLVLLAGGAALYVGWQEMNRSLDAPLALARPELFDIAPGSSMTKIANAFAARGWLSHAIYLRIEATRAKLAARLQAGTYELQPGDTPRALLRKFAAGDVKTYAVTFVEGARFDELLRQVSTLPGLEFELQGATPSEVLKAIGAPDDLPEGWLFPSTFHYPHQHSDRKLLTRAYRQMVEVLNRHWASRAKDLPYATPYDALIMASIIEKETGRADERKAIAGVFVRRLMRGMRLQTDPTVIYGLGAAYDGNLRKVDLQRDTPYNTYLHAGLPPTPICSPGEDAIIASLNPAPGDALYFVSRGDGSHAFSATLNAHNAAVRDYQRRRPSP